jgi:hypothetical protein
LYSGVDKLVYDSSVPNELDIEKAPEGALLFTDCKLSLYDYKRSVLYNKLLSILSV